MLISPKSIPVYVREILSRSGFEFEYLTTHPEYVRGFTIYIRKRTPYTSARVFQQEIKRFCNWADRAAQKPVSYILHTPEITHHCDQFAHVTILDPVMMAIEDYIKQ